MDMEQELSVRNHQNICMRIMKDNKTLLFLPLVFMVSICATAACKYRLLYSASEEVDLNQHPGHI